MNNTYYTNKLELVKNFLELDFVDFIKDYISIRINANQYDINLKNFINGYKFYSDCLMETILQNSCDFISNKTNTKIAPSYSIVNMMMTGDSYKSELNESSDIAAILHLGSSCNKEKSLLFFDDNSIEMSEGDLLIYNKRRITLIRKPINQKWLLQADLNFIDLEGPNKDNIYDRRPYLGFIN